MSSESKEGVLAVCGTLMGLSGLAVGLRFYTRKKQRAAIMVDDVLAVASLVTFVAASAVSITMVQHHIIGYALSPEIAGELSAKLQIVWNVLGLTSLACSKLSALFFYRRIFYIGGRQYWFNIVVISTVAVVILWLVVFVFLTGFQCGTHFSALWDGTYVKYCTISFPFLYGLAISDFLLDIWIVSLPIPSVLRLNVPWPKKFAVLGVFLLSLISVFASANRMAQFIQLENGGPDYLITYDEERGITVVVFYVMLEAGVSLVVVNLPTLWFLVTSVTPVIRSISSKLSVFSLWSGGSKTTTVDDVRLASIRPGKSPPELNSSAWNCSEVDDVEAYLRKDGTSHDARWLGKS